MKFIIPFLISFMLTASITPLVIRLATACKCLDVPGARRLHTKLTPRWGGVAFFVGVLPILFSANHSGALTSYIAASFLLVGMGMVDDRLSLGWKIKFAIMAAATAIATGSGSGNCTVNHLNLGESMGQLDLGMLSIPFTFFCIIGITNAINLLDGLNGLAGGVSLLAFFFMGIAALNSGNTMLALVCFAFVGGLAAFLPFNFPHARVFMGDTGSIFLGFSLAVVAIMLTQGNDTQVNVMFPVLILLIPIFDTIRVLLVRVRLGKNPFKGDNLHLHYLMVQIGQTSFSVVLQLWSLTLLLGSIALTLAANSTVTYLSVALYTVSLLVFFSIKLSSGHLQEDKGYRTREKNAEID